MQSNLRGFLQPARGHEAPCESRAAKKARREAALTALDLPWPEPPRQGAGRPTFQEKYEEALYAAIRSDAPLDLARITREAPSGWRPGDPLIRTLEEALGEAATVGKKAEQPDVAEEDVAEAEEGEPTRKVSRKEYIKLDPEAK